MIVDDKEKYRRIAICEKCPNYRKDARVFWVFKKRDTPQCGLCKCFLLSKAIWVDETCPLNKWDERI